MNASDNVDLYSGAAELSLELVSLPGRNGLDLNLSILYSSRIYDAATRWNLTDPTGVLGLGWSLPAAAQAWPQRPPKILVPFAAGGNIDVMARLAGARLGETLGQQFVIENRVGGNGSIATEAVARAAPDG